MQCSKLWGTDVKEFLIESLLWNAPRDIPPRKAMVRLIVAAATISLMLSLIDCLFRWEAYAIRCGELIAAAGIIKTGGMYGLTWLGETLFFAALLAIPRVGAWLSASAIALAWGLCVGYQSVAGRYPMVSDVWVVVHSDENAVSGAMSSYVSAGLILQVMLCVALGTAIGFAPWKYARPSPLKFRLGIMLLAGLFQFLYWNVMYSELNNYPAAPVSSMIRVAIFADLERREFYGIERVKLDSPAVPNTPKDNIIFILDESVCFDFITINNSECATTPELERVASTRPEFVNYGLMLAASTCSFSTKVLISTGTTEVPDMERRAMRNPTIFDLARNAGYRVLIYDSPGINYPNIAVQSKDLAHVELFEGSEIHEDSINRDIEAVRQIRNNLRDQPGAFVFLIKQGAHFHYETSYPRADPKYSRFQPRMEFEDSFGRDWNRTINSYKNALSWTVDAFAEELFKEEWQDTTILWTSDHGQDFFDPSQILTHCGSTLPMALVPFLTFSTNEWFLQHQLPEALPQGMVHSQHEIYPTLAALFAKDSTIRNKDYGAMMRENAGQQPKLKFMYGGIWAQTISVDVDPATVMKFWSFERTRTTELPGGNQAALQSNHSP